MEGASVPAGKCAAKQLRASGGLGRTAQACEEVIVLDDAEVAERKEYQQGEAADKRDRRALCDKRRDASPQATVGGCGALRLGTLANLAWPKRRTSQHAEQRGHERQTGREHHYDGDGEDRAERVIEAEAGQQKGQQRQHDGSRAGSNRLAHRDRRPPQRTEAILLALQLLAVARDQKDHVVRPRAEEQHVAHPGRLRVHAERASLDEKRGDRVHDLQDDADHHERQQRQQRRAIDQ